jgi:hypothetical protein
MEDHFLSIYRLRIASISTIVLAIVGCMMHRHIYFIIDIKKSFYLLYIFQTYWDMRNLERRLGLQTRYLTSEAEDITWAPAINQSIVEEQQQGSTKSTAVTRMDTSNCIVDLSV